MSDFIRVNTHHSNTLAVLEKVIAKSCECKLREFCPDKTSADCLKHRNLYAEAMLSGNVTK
jgi:hypothetical protein